MSPPIEDDVTRARTGSKSFEPYRRHVLDKIEGAEVGRSPFHHLFIEEILHPEFYGALRKRMLRYKRDGKLDERRQDSPEFVNRRHSLARKPDSHSRLLHAIFSDSEVKLALLRKFYLNPTPELERSLKIHEEFEFVYTAAGRFQEIHVDIPPKFMSFVFYFPEIEPSEEESRLNATVLYDKALSPHPGARYKSNSVCVFVPHFYSYHGFSTTIDRNALVMFYISPSEHAKWKATRLRDEPPYTGLKDSIQGKLTSSPLLEYGADPQRIQAEREACLVNAPRGRVNHPA